MQKQEFERLTGRTVDDKEYSFIEDMYLNAASMTKEEFCEEIRMHSALLDSEIVAALTETAKNETLQAVRRGHEIEVLKGLLLRAAQASPNDDRLWGEISCAIGRAAVVKHKLANKMALSLADVKYIQENLQ